jgi:thiol-disulfide isomerase/thioredoxin
MLNKARRWRKSPKIPRAAFALALLFLAFPLLLRAQTVMDLKVHKAPDFGSGDVWLDAGAPAPHHIADYHGHVVLVDFWEFTCINCIRDFGVVKRWYGKYHSYGFDVIAVHYGEFAIGFNVDNVREAAQRFRLPWPVVADQNGSTWKAYAADGWPNRYLIDPQGNIVMKLFGERNNREMETKIRELLAVDHPEVMKIELDPEDDGFRAECGNTTQEMFLGELYGRSAVGNMPNHKLGDVPDFRPLHSPPDGQAMLSGRWRVEHDGVTSQARDTSAELRYTGRSLYAVMNLTDAKKVRIDLFMDGNPLPKNQAGADVQFDDKGNAYIEVTDARMYYLVRSPALSAHLVALEPQANGLTLHSFTFGNNSQLADQP